MSSIQSATTQQQKTYKCFNCNAMNKTSLKCSQCKVAIYCNPTCQKQDWPNHKIVCRKHSDPPLIKPPAPQVNLLEQCLKKNEGFFFIVTDQKNALAYLYGTVHAMVDGWQEINQKVLRCLKGCREVLVEHQLSDLGLSEVATTNIENEHKPYNCVDINIMANAKSLTIPLISLEHAMDALKAMKSYQEEIRLYFESHPPQKKTAEEVAQHLMIIQYAWLNGDLNSALNALQFCDLHVLDTAQAPECLQKAFKEFYETRNQLFMHTILTKLQLPSDNALPVFIAVGFGHLFDFRQCPNDNENLLCTGIITALKQQGFTVSRLSFEE